MVLCRERGRHVHDPDPEPRVGGGGPERLALARIDGGRQLPGQVARRHEGQRAPGRRGGHGRPRERDENPAPQQKDRGQDQDARRPGGDRTDRHGVLRAEQQRLPPDLDHREFGKVRALGPAQEIEDLGASRVQTGRERGPRNGRLGRIRRAQGRIEPVATQARQVGQPAFRHVTIDQSGVRSVKPEDDNLLERRRPEQEWREQHDQPEAGRPA